MDGDYGGENSEGLGLKAANGADVVVLVGRGGGLAVE